MKIKLIIITALMTSLVIKSQDTVTQSVLTTTLADALTSTFATLILDNREKIIEKGFVYSSSAKGLTANKQYFYKPTQPNNKGASYGDIKSFTTKPMESCEHEWGEPVVYTGPGTTAYGIVTINGSPAEVGDLVGVFVEDELRGVGEIVINSGTSYTTILIQGTHIESLTFVIWDQSECEEVSVAFTTNSNPLGGYIGFPPNLLPLQAATVAISVPENQTAVTDVSSINHNSIDSGDLFLTTLGGADANLFEITTAGVLTFKTAPNFEAQGSNASTNAYRVIVTVDDGNGGVKDTLTITINVTDINESPVISDQTFSIAENTSNNASVGTVAASDPEGNTLSYSIESGNTGDVFAIDSSSGQITVVGTLDRETTPSYSLSVQVTEVSDGGTTGLKNTGTITINVTDINESPVISDQTFSIAENASNNASVGTVAASDPEGDTLSYSIESGNTGDVFAIDSSSGQITVVGTLDRETTPSYSLSVQVTEVSDGGTTGLKNTGTITINVTDINESPVISDQTFSIAENASNNASVGTVAASDPEGDTLSYSIESGNTGDVFAIDSSSGQITVVGTLDRETTPSYSLSVQVTEVSDGGTTGLKNTGTITINVTDINESPVINDQTFSIAENASNNAPVGTVAASDPEGDTLSYSIESGNTGDVFAIDSSSGQITVSGTLDHETTESYLLAVKVSDGGTPALSSAATITINITDINESPVISDQAFSLAEDAAKGAIVGTVAASDPEGDTLSYSIESGNTEGVFAIDSSSGEITVVGTLDRETTPSYSLRVAVTEVTDDGTTGLSSAATITINVTDINEPPTISDQTFSIAENASNETPVGTVAASDPEGDTLSYSIISGNTGGVFAIDSSSGQITVVGTLDRETTPSYSLSVQVTEVSDGGTTGLKNTGTITINITDINESPVLSDQTFSIAENASNNASVGTVAASDPEGDTLSYSIESGNTGGVFAIDSSSGQITVVGTLDRETTPSYSLSVQVTEVSDGGTLGLKNTATITINVTDINEPPTISDQTFSLAENASNETPVGIVAASDPEGDTLSYSIAEGNDNNVFAIDSSSGQITVVGTLDRETTPSYSLSVQVTEVSDGGTLGLKNTGTITINVTDINEPPTISDQTFSIAENASNETPVGTVAASDPEGDTLSYSIESGNTEGVFAIDSSSGQITVVGTLDRETTPSYPLRVAVTEVTDGGTTGLSSAATITINITDINEPPTISDQAFSLAEDAAKGAIVGTVAASDPEGDTLSYSIESGNTGDVFAIDSSSGQITVSGTLDHETTESYLLAVKVSDGGTPALSSAATITINITDINEPPTISDQTFSLAEDAAKGAIVGTVAASDPEGDTLSYSIESGNTEGVFAIDSASGQITVVGTLDRETTPSYSLSVQVTEVSDGGTLGLKNTGTITINVTDINEPPTISDQTFSIAENASNETPVGTVAASDPEGDTLSYSIESGNTEGVFAIDSSSGQITVVGTLDRETTPSYPLRVAVTEVTDGGTTGLSSAATITINVTDINESPVINDQTFSLAENASNNASVGTVAASDPEGDTLSYSIAEGNDNNVFAIDSSSGQITVSGTLDYEATSSYSLTVQVSEDDAASSSTAEITINITDINEAPVISDQAFSLAEDASNETPVGIVAASDPEGDTLSYSIESGNTGDVFAIDSSSGQITVSGTLDHETTESYLLAVKVIDGGTTGLTSAATITINITDINEPPTISDQTFSIAENASNETPVGTVAASDPEGDTLSYSIESGNTGDVFAIDSSSGQITVVGTLDRETTPSYPLRVAVTEVTDGGTTGLSSAATITINITDINEPPTISDQAFSLAEDAAKGAIVGTVAASDPEGDTLSYSIAEGNDNNVFAIDSSSGQITVSGTLDYEATSSYSLTVQVSEDDAASSSTAEITINITDINEAPVISDQTFSIAENASNETPVGTVAASDPEGDTLSYSIESGNTGDVFAIDSSSGQITVSGTLDHETTESYLLAVKVSDGGTPALSSAATITINITDINEPPTISDQTFSLAEDAAKGAIVGTVAASDPEGDTLSYSIESGNTEGVFAIDSSSGQITVVGTLDRETTPSYSLSVQVTEVSDGGTLGLKNTGTITINITDINESPVISDQTFSIAENASNETPVGIVAASDPEGDTLSYSIESGNTGGVFAIDSSSGQITVVGTLDRETTPSYSLSVQVTEVSDGGTTGLKNTGTITINVTDINESPVISDQTFSIAENASNNASVGTVAASDPEGDTLSYSIESGNTGDVFAIDSSSGQITVVGTLDRETTESYLLAVKVIDGGTTGLSSAATITINITDINESPVISDQAFSLAEDAAKGAIVGTVAASDPEGDTLSYSIESGNTEGVFAIDSASGQITVVGTLDHETTPSYPLRVAVTEVTDDGTTGLSSAATITINVTDINEPPTISDQTFSLAENASNETPVGIVAASDPEGDTLSYSIAEGNDNNVFAIDSSSGQITVVGTLDRETTPSYSLSVQVTEVSDGGTLGLKNTGTITINVTDINEPPTISDQTFSIAENASNETPVGTVAASDPEGDTLSYSIESGNTGDVFAIDSSSGQITVVGTLDRETTPSYPLRVAVTEVTDGGTTGLSSAATITINITDINEPPTISDQAFSLAEDAAKGAIVGTVAASDPEGDTLSYSIAEGNDNNVFAIDSSSGQITVVGTLDRETTESYLLAVKVSDGGTPALSSAATITINITDINESPVISDQTFSLAEDAAKGAIVGTVAASDPEGDTLSYSIESGNTEGVFAIDSASGQITVVGTLDHETTPSYPLRVAVTEVTDDGTTGLSSAATITINVTDINEPPTISDQTFSLAENASNETPVGIVAASDPEGDTLSYSIAEGNDNNVFAIDSSSGQITVVGTLDRETTPSYSLSVQVTEVSDGGTLGLKNTGTITINVTDINEPPTISDQTFSIAENASNETPVGTVAASDPEGDTLSYSIESGNTGDVFAIDSSSGQITVVGTLDRETTPSYSLSVQVTEVSDGGTLGLKNTGTITINVTDINEPPTISDQTFSIAENASNETPVGIVAASDPEGDTLSYSIESGNTGDVFAIDSSSGQITVVGTLDRETTPSYSLTVQVTEVSDGGTTGLKNTGTITINITDINESPVISDQTFSIAENASNNASVGIVAASDPEGDTLSYSIESGNTGGVFAIDSSSGQITVVGTLDRETTPSYPLRVAVTEVTDGGTTGLSSAATITINITDINEPPTISDQTFSLAENASNETPVGIVAASDPEGDTLSYSIESGNTGDVFAIDSSSGQITVVGTLDRETTPSYSLTVQVTEVSDGGTTGLKNTGTITINVTDINEPPTISDQTFSIAENASNNASVGIVAASDPEGDTLSYSIESGNTEGVFAIDSSSGQITVVGTLDHETTPSYPLRVAVTEVTDDGTTGLSSAATITINVTDINEPPTISDQTFSLAENASNETPVGIVAASDPEGDTLSYSIAEGNDNNVFAIDSSSGQITVVGTLDRETTPSYSLSVQVTEVSDGGTLGLKNTGTITINVTDINEPPTISDQTFSIAENASNETPVGIVAASDPEGDTLSYSIESGNTGDVFAIDSSSGQITVVGTLDRETTPSYSLTVQVTEVSDGGTTGLKNTGTITINITDINESPVISDQTFSLAENASNNASVGTVAASDPEGDTLSYSIESGNTGDVFAIDSSSGQITVVGSLDHETTPSYPLRVAVTEVIDGATTGLSSAATITINITDVNDAPEITGGATSEISVPENQTAVTDVDSTDEDSSDPGDFFSTTLEGADAGLFEITTAGVLTFKSAPNFEAPSSHTNSNVYTVVVKAEDGNLGTDTQSITITVTDVNDAPVALADTATTTKATAVTISVLDNDTDEETSASLIVTNLAADISPSNGSVKLTNNSTQVIYTPAENFNGTDTFSYTPNDGTIDGNAVIVKVTVTETGESSLSTDNDRIKDISVSPNPTSGILNITAPEKVNYKLFNIKAQILKKGTLATGKSKIDISPFAKGIYLLNIKTSKGSFTKKVVRK